ncbi:MAG TPA: hypothetical protein VF131_13085 [Blastocatellia bacterium]|nr:hypothetical protein [Blastocatellia bacterium]
MKSLEGFSCSEWEDAARPFSDICDKTEPSPGDEPLGFAYMHEVEEVNLDCLRPRDYVIIHTENSVYRFTIIDPRERYGVLTGGSLGYPGLKTRLVETIPANSPDEIGRPRVVKERSRAVFRIPGGKKAELLITSLITKLIQVTDGFSTISLPAN